MFLAHFFGSIRNERDCQIGTIKWRVFRLTTRFIASLASLQKCGAIRIFDCFDPEYRRETVCISVGVNEWDINNATDIVRLAGRGNWGAVDTTYWRSTDKHHHRLDDFLSFNRIAQDKVWIGN